MIKFYSEKSKAKRALKSISEAAFQDADNIITQNPDNPKQWGFDPIDVEMQYSEVMTQDVKTADGLVPLVQGSLADVAQTLLADTKPAVKKEKLSKVKKVHIQHETQNGVKKPLPGGLCYSVWQWLTDCANNGIKVDAKDLKNHATLVGWNLNNASIEFYRWRKFYNVK